MLLNQPNYIYRRAARGKVIDAILRAFSFAGLKRSQECIAVKNWGLAKRPWEGIEEGAFGKKNVFSPFEEDPARDC